MQKVDLKTLLHYILFDQSLKVWLSICLRQPTHAPENLKQYLSGRYNVMKDLEPKITYIITAQVSYQTNPCFSRWKLNLVAFKLFECYYNIQNIIYWIALHMSGPAFSGTRSSGLSITQ